MDIMDSQTASPNLNTLKEHLSKTPQKPAFPLGDVRKWSNSSKIDERNGAILASVTINTSDRNFDNIIHHYLQNLTSTLQSHPRTSAYASSVSIGAQSTPKSSCLLELR